jgi:hypothetical protein
MTEENVLYVANPEVSCREEGAEGALLFNPDTDQVVVVNITGFLIWQTLSQPCSLGDIVTALAEQCENIPDDLVAGDVSEFIQPLLTQGFVGIYEGVAA